MILVDKISKNYSGTTILDDITATLKAKVTFLVGKNGCGKSTLLNIIAGKELPDSGRIVKSKTTTIDYLEQNTEKYLLKDLTVNEYVNFLKNSSKHSDLKEKEEEILKKMENLTEKDNYEELLNQLTEVQHQISDNRINSSKQLPIEKILKNLGFSEEFDNKKISELSGGWKMRLELASVMFKYPNVIMLDEPTNYLDLDSILFLKEWIKNFKGKMLLVSHDRDFVNYLAEEIWEIDNHKLTVFKGNYDFYETEKQKLIETKIKQRKKQLEEIAKLELFIEKNRTNAATASRAQSKIKTLEKIKSELIEIPQKSDKIYFELTKENNSGNIVSTLENVYFSFDEKKLINNFSRIIKKGEKIAIAGRNGLGKTTLLKIITQNLEPKQGVAKLGHNVTISYYRQDEINNLPKNKTILEFMEEITPFELQSSIKTIISSFLFLKKDWDKKIEVLSGGEKVRLALIKIILNPGNLIILDEPTTHLDIDSREIVLDALKKTKSTIIFVSHDTHFINELATSLIYFKNRGEIESFPGNLNEFNEMYKKNDYSFENNEVLKPKEETKIKSNEKKLTYTQYKQLKNKIKTIQKEIEKIEEEIESTETEKNKYIEMLTNQNNDLLELGNKIKKIEIFLEKLNLKWEDKMTEMEELEILWNENNVE